MTQPSQENHQPIWAEISCSALRWNFHLIRSHVRSSTQIMAVVKGNGYGHGALPVASLLEQEGADLFGVARFSEAEQLREGKISRPILIFGITDPALAPSLAAGNYIQTVHSTSYIDDLQKAAKAAGCTIRVHLKVDTGMGRMGVVSNGKPGSVTELVNHISKLDSLMLEGIYTHFACCDAKNLNSANQQLNLFHACLEEVPPELKQEMCIHASNSAATMVLPEAYFSMVRPGIMLYGLTPSAEMDSSAFALTPAMSIKAKISHIKRVPKGFPVGYDHTHITENETVIATVPVGYADGYPRLLSSKGKMLIGGVYANIVGRVCMDQLMLDVGHIPNVKEGDEVVILGRQGGNEITADDLAAMTNTINYEVVSRILPRIPRVYID